MLDSTEGGTAARKLLGKEDLMVEVREGCFFALAKSTRDDDAKLLAEWAKKPDEAIRAAVARAIGYAVRTTGGAAAGVPLIDRLRVDPSPLVRCEAAIAFMEHGHDTAALLDGALALDQQDRHILEKPRAGPLYLAATGEWGDTTTLFLDICRAYDKLNKNGTKLEARPGMNLGRTREVIRLARAGSRRS